MSESKPSLDPEDWENYRSALHDLVDACVNQLRDVRQHPWKPVGEDFVEAVRLGDGALGRDYPAVAAEMAELMLPRHAGSIHPRFFGWVQGTGNAAALMAEIVAATMNSNCGGRDHGAVYVEREVVRWCADCFGFPAGASGVLVSGTSQATVLALAAARLQALGPECRKKGVSGFPRTVLFAARGAHNAVTKAAALIGAGSEAVRWVPVDAATGGMSVSALRAAVREARAEGALPFCVVGTAGSVDLGSFDPLGEIAEVCAEEKLWLHVDGAYGAWARLAEPPWRDLTAGIERADSLALDFHKWMFVQYDCGLILMRDEQKHRAAFAERPAYLAAQGAGIGGGDPWYCDYGTDLSRSFRALKVWATLRTYGAEHLGRAITRNCRLARMMAEQVERSGVLELAAPVRSNVCCFGVRGADAGEAGRLNTAIAQRLQNSGEAVFSTTTCGGRTVLRAAITNHRTTEADVAQAIAAAAREAARLQAGGA